MKKILMIAIAILGTACGKNESPATSSPTQTTLSRPFVSDYWIDTVTNERLELIGISRGSVSGLTFTYPDASGIGDVRCAVDVVFSGDQKSGTVTVSSPNYFSVSPNTAASIKCEWIKTIVAYQIIGTNLEITYDGAQKRSFEWNGVR